jgi:hypothetical protein
LVEFHLFIGVLLPLLVITPGDFFVRYDRLDGHPSCGHAFPASIRVTANPTEVNSDILFISRPGSLQHALLQKIFPGMDSRFFSLGLATGQRPMQSIDR